MSKLKVKNLVLMIMLIFCSALFLACGNKTPVESIHFANDEIVLLVGDSFTPNVEISPSYASNKNYSLSSSNPEIVVVNSKSITALKEGEVIIRVTSDDNSLHEDVLKVKVTKTKSTLLAPRVNYNPTNQTFNFDTINNASSYIIKINSQEIDLGNNNSFSLANFEKEFHVAYDRVLNVQVKAKAPTYSHAYEDSEFSQSLNVYQAEAPKNVKVVGGVLLFDKTISNSYQVNLGLNEFTTSSNSVSLTEHNTLTNEHQNLNLTALVNDDIKQAGVYYYNSLPVSVRLFAIEQIKTNQIGNVVNWQNDLNVKAYQIFVDDKLVETTSNVFFNFEELPNYSTIGYQEQAHKLKIVPVLQEYCTNVISSENANAEFDFNRVPTPVLSVENNLISWGKSEFASAFAIEISYGQETFKTTTLDNSFNLNNFTSNQEYNFKLSALAAETDIFFLPSFEATTKITKNAVVDAKIENYLLKFNSIAGHSYKIEFLDSESSSDIVDGNNGEFELDLSRFSFSAGEHQIAVTHLGDGSQIFDSAATIVKFVQYEDNATINISDSIINVEISELNKNATLKLQIVGEGVDYEIEASQHAINSTMESSEKFLSAGEYKVYLFILGDGSNSFSIPNNGRSVTSATFTVLPPPELKQVNKTLEGFTFEEMIAGAVSYNLYVKNGENFDLNSNFEFDFENFPVSIKLQSVGDGTNFISSKLSNEYEIYKLEKPTLTFDKATGIISKTDENLASQLLEYEFLLNGNKIDYDFATPFTDFVIGENEFSLTAIAIDPMGNKFYLNSDPFVLNINLINETSDVTVNANNQLEIVPTDQTEKLNLTLTFVFDEEMTFETVGNSLVCGDISLSFEFINGKYVIDLLNEDYSPIISQMTADFSIKFKFASTDNKTVDSVFTTPTLVVLEEKTTVSRSGQFLTINLVKQTDRLENYALFINNTLLLDVPANSVIDSENQLIKIDVNELFNQLNAKTEIISLNVITKNVDSVTNSPRLSVKSEKVYFAHANSVELCATKNNLAENNSVVISFNLNTQAIVKTYEVYVYNIIDNKKINLVKKVFTEISDNSSISFNLDEFDLLGKIYVDCMVLSADTLSGEQNVMIFNSELSNTLEFNKIDAVENIYVTNGILHFNAVENAIGYEIYKITNGIETKLNTKLILTNSYDISGITGQETVAVKAISAENFTNSNLSEGIVINKTSIEKLQCVNGEIVLTLSNDVIDLFKQESVDIVINVKNGSNEFNLNSQNEGIEIVDNKFIIQPYVVLSYGANSLLKETLTFQIKVNYTETSVNDIYYLNSNSEIISAYGIFAPTNLKKNSTESNSITIVENISYLENDKNVLNGEEVSYGYRFKLVVDGKTYYSTNKNLKYFNNSTKTYESYPDVILGQSFIFPAGHDDNGDGLISEQEAFGAGNYTFSVQTVAKTLLNINLLNSNYSNELTFSIMETPILTIENGEIVWANNINAEKYIVRIYENDFATIKEVDNVVVSNFDFSNEKFNEYVGLFGVSVQAISSKDLIVNSLESEIIAVFRQPAVTQAIIDDGNLVINANKYFNKAIIEFVDISGRSETITFENLIKASQELEKLNINSWKDYNIANQANLLTNQKYIVISLTNEILNIMANRSYNINIKLIGNSNSELAIINSKTIVAVSEMLTTKLATSLNETKLGVVKFDYLNEYENINLNYNFNNQLEENVSSFLQKTKIFRINITTNNVFHTIYALDYNSFNSAIANSDLNTSDFALVEEKGDLYAYYKFPCVTKEGTQYLYFNVFKENSFNLRLNDYLYYYAVNVVENNGEMNYVGAESELDLSIIDIANGGSFVVGLTLLGGDSYNQDGTPVGFLTSNENVLKTFVRYGENYVSTQNGLIKIDNLIFTDEDGVILDYPIYKIGVNSINSTDKTYYYLYYNNITREQVLAIIGAENEDYLFALTEDENGNLLFDLSGLVESGTYQVDIRTLAGPGKGSGDDVNYILNSKLPSINYIVKKISTTQFSVNNGMLISGLAHVASSTGNTYIYDYEITIIDEASSLEYVYQIGRYSEGVKISNNTMYYEIPANILVDNKLVEIVNGRNYSIKVKALAGTNQYIVNASFGDSFTFKRSLGVSEVYGEQPQISNGKIIWKVKDLENYTHVKIRLSYLDENLQIRTIVITDTGKRVNNADGGYAYHYYEIEDIRYPLENSSSQVYVNSDVDYTLTISVLGNNDINNSIINSAASAGVIVNRLHGVENASIVALNGVLTWDAVPDAVGYIVTLVGDKTYTFTITNNSIDFSTTLDDNSQKLEVGNYNVSIRALGACKINSQLVGSTNEFRKLEIVEGIKIDAANKNQIVWDKVNGADGYLVTFIYQVNGISKTESNVVKEERITVPDDLTGTYSVEIVACGVDLSYVFNSEVATFVSSKDRPNPVGPIYFDEVEKRYYWSVADDFLQSDKLRISFNLAEYRLNNDTIETAPANLNILTIRANDPNSSFISNGITYYFLKPTVMGVYTNFTVQVEREDSIYSSTSRGADKNINFYAYGAGTNENPYRLQNAAQLFNVEFNKSAHYELISSIDMSSTNLNERIEKFGAIVTDEFSGVIDGNNYVITGINNVQLTNKTTFALFKELNKATISNLTIGQLDVPTVITDSFTATNSNSISLAMVAVTANNSTLNNIGINKTTLVLAGTGILAGRIYLSGLVAQTTNTTISACNVDLTINVNVDFTGLSWLGGAVAQATGTSIVNEGGLNTITLSITQQKTNRKLGYVGGVAGQFEGDNNRTNEISNTNVEVNYQNIYVDYVGGVVGLISKAKILNCKTTGTISNSRLNTNTYIGGVTGFAQSAIIESSGTSIEFNLVVTNSNQAIYVGVIAGGLSTTGSINCLVTQCYASYEVTQKETTLVNGTITLGIYGTSTKNNIEVDDLQIK